MANVQIAQPIALAEPGEVLPPELLPFVAATRFST